MTMIERVARAIYEADEPWHPVWPWPKLKGEQLAVEEYRRIARAAIEAMREPTEGMVDAVGGSGARALKSKVFTAMIDAALNEEH